MLNPQEALRSLPKVDKASLALTSLLELGQKHYAPLSPMGKLKGFKLSSAIINQEIKGLIEARRQELLLAMQTNSAAHDGDNTAPLSQAPKSSAQDICQLIHTKALEEMHIQGLPSSAFLKIEPLSCQELEACLEGLCPDLAHSLLERLFNLSFSSLRRLINASGVILHTNLGRAPLSHEAQLQLMQVSRSYSNLEYRLQTASRGQRLDHVEELLCSLTGAEAACVVNNNAAAVMLILMEFSKGKEAIVSRGELIEIGGSFRIPDIMELSGALMREVGTTNKTHLYDIEQACTPQTALVLKVHPSNYRVCGFTESPKASDLCKLAHEKGLLVYEDQGSGVLVKLKDFGLCHERSVQEALADGMDLVSCSGDKLLGSTQAGIIFGKKELIARLKKNPFMRALRLDKLCLASLEASLRLYLHEQQDFLQELPLFKMMCAQLSELEERALRLKELVSYRLKQELTSTKFSLEICTELQSVIGGGSLPTQELDSCALVLRYDKNDKNDKSNKKLSAQGMQDLFLQACPLPVVGRVVDDFFAFDMRTIQGDAELEELADCIEYIFKTKLMTKA